MTLQSIVLWFVLLALVCWCLGAYNRLVRLRAAVRQAFTPVDEAMVQASTWLLDHAPAPPEPPTSALGALESDRPAAADPVAQPALRGDIWDSSNAATQQLSAAAAQVRRDPLNARAVAALSAALTVFQQVLQRVLDSDAVSMNPAEIISGESAILVDSVAKTQRDMVVDLAAQGFNNAVLAYNAAIATFPARVLAMFLGFSAAACIQRTEQST